MKRKILCLSSLAACLLLLILLYVHYKQSEWDSLSDYAPELKNSSVQSIELFQIWSNAAFPFRKKTESKENILELLDIMSGFSIKRTDYTKENAPYPDGGEFLVRLTYDTGETLTINICGILTFEGDSIIYEFKGDDTKLWDTCTAVEEEWTWEETPDFSNFKASHREKPN